MPGSGGTSSQATFAQYLRSAQVRFSVGVKLRANSIHIGLVYPVTPDGRYFAVRGKLWRRADPSLPEQDRQPLVHDLMAALRAVAAAKRT